MCFKRSFLLFISNFHNNCFKSKLLIDQNLSDIRINFILYNLHCVH